MELVYVELEADLGPIDRPGSEKALGELGAPANFVIHSKAPGFISGALKRDSILAAAKQTFEQLAVKSVWQSSWIICGPLMVDHVGTGRDLLPLLPRS